MKLYKRSKPLIHAAEILLGVQERHADSDPLTGTSCRNHGDRADSAAEQIQKQLAACHFLVADREEEAIAHILVQILFIHKVEAMTKEYLLGPCSPAAIFTHLAHEVIFPVRRRSEHFSEGVLSGM